MKSNYKFKFSIKAELLSLVFIVFVSLQTFAEEGKQDNIEKGLVLLSKNKFSDALILFDIELNQQPENVKVLNYKAKTLYYLQKHDDSMEIISKILEYNPNNIDALYLKSLILLEKRELDDSLNTVNQILESYSEYGPAISTKCSLLSEMNRDKEAKDCLKSIKKW